MENNRIRQLADLYDEILPFNRYLNLMFPEYNFEDNKSFKICCPLHEEKTPSFSYSHSRDIWTCFGACHTSGKTVRFHYLWLVKQYGNGIKLITAIRDLYEKFSYILPNPDEFLNENKNKYTIGNNKGNRRENLAWGLENSISLANKSKNKNMKVLKEMTFDEELLKIFISGYLRRS